MRIVSLLLVEAHLGHLFPSKKSSYLIGKGACDQWRLHPGHESAGKLVSYGSCGAPAPQGVTRLLQAGFGLLLTDAILSDRLSFHGYQCGFLATRHGPIFISYKFLKKLFLLRPL